MDTIQHFKNLIEAHDLNKAELAREIGFSKERFHYFLNVAKSCPLDIYAKLRRSLENRGIRVDDLDTMSITGLAAYVNNEAGRLVMECIQSLADGCITEEEKHILRQTIVRMREDLAKLEERL